MHSNVVSFVGFLVINLNYQCMQKSACPISVRKPLRCKATVPSSATTTTVRAVPVAAGSEPCLPVCSVAVLSSD
jgi:hypothetical protein